MSYRIKSSVALCPSENPDRPHLKLGKTMAPVLISRAPFAKVGGSSGPRLIIFRSITVYAGQRIWGWSQ